MAKMATHRVVFVRSLNHGIAFVKEVLAFVEKNWKDCTGQGELSPSLHLDKEDQLDA